MSDKMNEKRKAMTMASRLLRRRIRIRLTDGRVLIGNLQCLDKQGNILLANAVEIRKKQVSCLNTQTAGSAINAGWDERMVGLVIIPPQHRKTCEVKATETEAVALFEEVD